MIEIPYIIIKNSIKQYNFKFEQESNNQHKHQPN